MKEIIRSEQLLFYYRHSKLIVKYNVDLKAFLQQGIFKTVLVGIKFINSNELNEIFLFMVNSKKITIRCKRVGYNIGIMRQSACLDENPITVPSYGFLVDGQK